MDVVKLFVDAGFERDLYGYEQLALQYCIQVIRYYSIHNRYPLYVDTDLESIKLYKWLISMRRAYANIDINVKSRRFYPSLQKLADDAGLSDMFMSNSERKALDICMEIIHYVKKYGHLPHKRGESSRLGQWLTKMRMAKKGIVGSSPLNRFYPSLQHLATKHGIPDLFETKDYEKLAQIKCKTVIKYRDVHGRWPPENSTESDEVLVMARWLNGIRKGRSTLYPSLQVLADNAGYPDMFMRYNPEEIALDKCNKLIEYYTTYKKIPPNGNALGKWALRMRAVNNGRDNVTILYPSVIKLLNEAGLGHILNEDNFEKRALVRCESLVEYYQIHKDNLTKFPHKKWLTYIRAAYRENNTGSNKIYQSTIDMLKSNDMLHLLNPVS
jgi:hypothetical protein